MKRILRAFCAALVAVAFSSFAGLTADAKAEGNGSSFAEMQSGSQGYAGAPINRTVAKRAIKASTATPVDTPDPIPVVAGHATVYNASEAPFEGLVRIVGKKGSVTKIADFVVSIDPWDNIVFDLQKWSASYRVSVIEDLDGNDMISSGDRVLKRTSGHTSSRRWSQRHGGHTKSLDLVVVGSGDPTEPPISDYESYVKTQGDYGYVTPTYSAPFYGQTSVMIEVFLVSLGDQPADPTIVETVTRTVTAPASASSPSMFITTSGVPATTPAGHANGEFGVILDTPGRQIYRIRIGGAAGQTFNFWRQVPVSN